MRMRVLAGSAAAYFYSAVVGRLPSRKFRHLYLSAYLGKLGQGCGVQLGCRFLNGRKVYLGDRTVINNGCLLDGRKYPICIGCDVSIGPEATVLTLGHNPQSPEFEDTGGQVDVGNHVWIAYRALVLPGVKIGEGAVVGAGAVVTKDVEPFTIVAGNPARKVGERIQDLRYRLSHRPFLA